MGYQIVQNLQTILLTRWGKEGINKTLGHKHEPTVLSAQCNTNYFWSSFLIGVEKKGHNQWPQVMHWNHVNMQYRQCSVWNRDWNCSWDYYLMGFMVVHYLPLRLIWFLQEIDELHGELTRTTPYVSFTYLNETNVHQMPGCDTVFDLLSWLSGRGSCGKSWWMELTLWTHRWLDVG